MTFAHIFADMFDILISINNKLIMVIMLYLFK